ncbi:UNVERIFIED_CONTAM: HAD superfamily phosphatase (TIGR01681 family)/FkbH-like protein [Acetivibrio alkalicellulosi]
MTAGNEKMKIKCLVWDLDDTLWEGTLSENWEIIFTQEKRDLIKKIDEVGILQSIASRNDLEKVLLKLGELEISDYFLYPQCHWGSKVESIKAIADKLNIGFDTIGYIEDNPFELSEVQFFLPEVRGYKAQEYSNLLNLEEFKSSFITNESKLRRKMMKSRQEREDAEGSYKGSREDFLKSCNMELTVRCANSNDVDRIYELAHRTNQMNNILDRLDRDVIVDYVNANNKVVLVSELEDRFGQYGIIGTSLFEIKDRKCFINLFCISCRIEGRGIGAAFLNEAIDSLASKYSNINEVYCHYIDEKKNRPALMLLQVNGFKHFSKEGKKSTYVLKLPMEKDGFEWLKINNIT